MTTALTINGGDIATPYRPGLNPAFVARAKQNNTKRAAREHALEQARLAAEKNAERERQSREALTNKISELEGKIQKLENRILVQEAANSPRPKDLRQIMVRVSMVTGISPHDMRSNIRVRKVVFARKMFCYWSRRLTVKSFPQIGRFLGNRDHTTIIHAVNTYPIERAKMGRTIRKLR